MFLKEERDRELITSLSRQLKNLGILKKGNFLVFSVRVCLEFLVLLQHWY